MSDYTSHGRWDAPKNQIGRVACETRLKYRDIFHLKNLYKYMHEWLINDGYGTHKNEEWRETLYMSNQRADGEELFIWWRLNKFRDNNKESAYFKKILDVDMHVMYLQSVEKVIKGKKYKVNSGEIELIITGRLAVDPGGEWRKHWFLKHIHDYYWKFIMQKMIKQQKQELYQDAYKFHAAIKDVLKLYQVQPDRKPFRSFYGFGDHDNQ